MSFLTKSAYADSRGWSRAYVSKLAKQGRLVLDAAGRVDAGATDAFLASTADPSKAGVADRHQRDRAEKGVHALVAPTAPSHEPAPNPDKLPDFQKARARREHFLALLAEDEFRKGRGELVERDAVDRVGFEIARTLRDLLMGLPAKVSGELISIDDPWEMERRLTGLLRQVLDDADRLIAPGSVIEHEAEEAD